MTRHSARVMRIFAGLLVAVCGGICAASLVFDLPLAVTFGSFPPAAAAAVALLRATHVETKLNKGGNQ